MDRTNRWKLGLFVLVSAGAALCALLWLGAERLQRESIPVFYFFDEEVSGLEIGAPVKFRGVTMGKVTSIRIASDRRHVEVAADVFLDSLQRIGLPSVRPDTAMPDDLRAQLITSLLTGVTYIQTDFFDVAKYPVPDYGFPVPPNTIHTARSTAKSLETGLLDVVDALPTLASESTRLVERVHSALDEIDLQGIAARLRDLLDALEHRVANLEELPVLVRGEAALAAAEEMLVDLRALSAELADDAGPLHSLLRHLDAVGAELESAFGKADLAATAAAVREAGAAMGDASTGVTTLARDVRSELDSLWRALEAVRRLADLLERDPGALLRGRTPSGVTK